MSTDKPVPEFEIIDREEEEDGDYSFTMIMTFPPSDKK